MRLIISLMIISVLFLCSCTNETKENLFSDDMQDKSNEKYQPDENNNNNNDGCSNIKFTEYFTEPRYIKSLGQIGAIHGSGTTVVGRSYVHIKDEFANEKIPIYAPVNMTLTMGSYYFADGFGKITTEIPNDALPDYILHFDVGCGYNLEFCHLKEVVPEIQKRFPKLRNTSATDSVEPIKINAGELIGYFILNKGVAAFDIIVNNESKINQFQNQKRYEFGQGSNLLHSMCPYDMYVEQIKNEYYALFGSEDNTLLKTKNCGNISRDSPGTVSGLWYLEEEPVREMHLWIKEGDYGSPVPIIGDERRVSIGDLGDEMIWIYNDNPTYKNPLEITNEHCYQMYSTPTLKEGYVYLKVLSDSSIKISYGKTGSCPTIFPKNNSRIYYK